MDMDQSLRDSLNQLIALQAQQLSAINNIAASNARIESSKNYAQSPQFANSSYMNYAPNYMPPMMPFSQSTQAAQQRFYDYAGAVGGGASLSDLIFANKSKMSMEQRNMMASDYGAKFSNAGIAGAGFIASAGADIGMMALAPGLISGIAAGAVGGAVVGGLFDIGLQQNAQNMAYNRFLQRESYRFVNPMVSRNDRDIAGFGMDDRFAAAKFLRHFNTEAKISDQETSMLLEKFTEGNLLKGVKDLENFKDKMRSLTKYVKQSALLLNETFEDVTNLMSEMQKAGIDVANIDYMSAKNKVIGAFTGMSAGQVMKYTTGTATGMVQGTNYAAGIQSERLGDTLLYMDALYEKSRTQKLTNPAMKDVFTTISNLGGSQNAATVMADVQNKMMGNQLMSNSAIAFFDYSAGNNTFSFNQDAFQAFLNSGANMSTLAQAAKSKMTDIGIVGTNTWMRNRESFIRNSLSADQSNQFIERTLNAMQASSSNPSIRDANLSYKDKISLLLGDNSMEARLYGSLLDYQSEDKGELIRKAKALTYQQNLLANINSSRPGFGYEVKNVWEKFKDTVGDAFAPIGETATKVSQGLSDWWYGTEVKFNRSVIDKGFSAESVKGQGQQLANEVIKGVQEGLRDAKAKGFNVKDDVLKMFSVDDKDLSDWRNKVISYKREVFSTTEAMGADMKKYADVIKEASKTFGTSETSLVGLMRYGRDSGRPMGMGAESIAEVSKNLGMSVYQADENARIKAVTQRLGGLITEYGGNQELAQAAMVTSKAAVDEALMKYGINAAELRKSGNQNQIKSISYNQIKNYMSGGDKDAVDNLRKYQDMGNVTTFDETQKEGLGAAPDVVKYIRSSAQALGIKDENLMATLIATESGGRNIRSWNASSRTTDWGPAQLNDASTASVMAHVGQTYKLPSGRTVTVTNDNWKTDEELNVYLGEKIFKESLDEAKGNPALAYSLYNAYSIKQGNKRVPIMDIVRTRLKNQGVTAENMDDAIKNMSSEEVIGLLRTAGGTQVANNVLRFMNIYAQGLLPGKTPEVIQQEVLKSELGRNLNAKEVEEYRKGLMGGSFATSSSFTFEGMKNLYQTFTDLTTKFDTVEETGLKDLPSMTSLFGYYMSDKSKEEYKQKLYKGLGQSWGINYDGSLTSFTQVTTKLRTESDRIDKMLSEYDESTDKANTEWAKLPVSERAGLLQIRRVSSVLRNEKKVFDPSKYATAEDLREQSHIETHLFGLGKPTYNKEYTKGSGYQNYMDWLTRSGQMDYKLPSGVSIKTTQGATIGDTIKELKSNITSIEADSKAAKEEAEQMIAGDMKFSSEEDKKEYFSVVKNALLGDESAQKELQRLSLKLGEEKKKMDASVIKAVGTGYSPQSLETINKALGVTRKLRGADIESMLKAIQELENTGKRVEQFGQMGGTLMGLITGKEESGRDFQKRYTKDVLGKDYSKLESGTEHRIVSGGAQELVNEISKLKGNEKGINDFIERLKSEAPLQTPEETVKKLQDAFTSANDSQEELKKVIYDIMAEWGSMINQANPAQTIKESGEVTKELQESLQKMTDTVTQTVDLIGKATINLQKKQDAVVSKNWITGLFGIQDQ